MLIKEGVYANFSHEEHEGPARVREARVLHYNHVVLSVDDRAHKASESLKRQDNQQRARGGDWSSTGSTETR